MLKSSNFVLMKAKHIGILILTLVYLVSVTGFAFSLHFCGGKVKSIAFKNAQKGCSICSKMAMHEKDNDCCKNTKVEIKVTDNHQHAAKTELQKLFEVVLDFKPISITAPAIPPLSVTAFNFNKPPPKGRQVSLHILNCTFRI